MRLAVAVIIAAWAFLWTRKAPHKTDLVLMEGETMYLGTRCPRGCGPGMEVPLPDGTCWCCKECSCSWNYRRTRDSA